MLRVSRRFKIAVRLADQHSYEIAAAAQVNATFLSQILRGKPVRPDDDRVLRLAAVVGVPSSAVFERQRAEAVERRAR